MKNYFKYIVLFTISVLSTSCLKAIPMDITFNEVLRRMGKTPFVSKNRLNAWYYDGHGSVEFMCKDCNEGEGLHEFFSLSIDRGDPGIGDRGEQSNEKVSLLNWLMARMRTHSITQIAAGAILKAVNYEQLTGTSFDVKGKIAWHGSPWERHSEYWEDVRDNGSKISENVLTDLQAQVVMLRLVEFWKKSMNGKVSYNFLSHNCMDFPQAIYEATGLSGHYLNDFKEELNLYWENGQISPASVYAYAKYGGIRKLIEQIYSQMILGNTVKNVQKTQEMCENVVANEYLPPEEVVQAYEKAVAGAYQVYAKTIYTGIDKCDVKLLYALVRNIRQQTIHGFKNIGFATDGSLLSIIIQKGENSNAYKFPLSEQAFRGGLLGSVESLVINVRTDHDAQVHWVEVEVVGPKE